MQNAKWDEIAKSLSCFPEGVDLVIHNTGLSQHSAAVETKPSVVDSMFRINTVGPIAMTQALLPGMLKQKKGQFVVVASMAAKVPSPGQAVYAATKFGLLGYFHTLRTELASRYTRFNLCFSQAYTVVVLASLFVVQGHLSTVVEEQRGLCLGKRVCKRRQ